MPDEIPDPFVEPLIEHGVKVSGIEHEEGAFILTLEINPMRDQVVQQGDSRADEYEYWHNPRIEFEFTLRPRRDALGMNYGLGDVHPGTAATSLINLPVNKSIHGFRISASASIIMGNPKDSRGEDGRSITQPGTYKPFTKSAAAIAALPA
ncbi:MAG TPA: hypothetical protein DDZ88_16455 [Verrucomicrobiales bacterium]|nr:hypothetical protein [Verrucomicrobiales bacterium]